MHHGYKPFGTPDAKVDMICDSSLLEAVGHVSDILLLDVVEVIEAIKTCPSTDRYPLVWDPETNPIEALIDYDVGVNHSRHDVDVVACLWNNRRR